LAVWGWVSRRREQEILEMEKRHLTHILRVAEAMLELLDALEAWRRPTRASRRRSATPTGSRTRCWRPSPGAYSTP